MERPRACSSASRSAPTARVDGVSSRASTTTTSPRSASGSRRKSWRPSGTTGASSASSAEPGPGSGASMRIGLLGDTHDAIAPFEGVRDRVAEAFHDAERILHCGDLTTTGVLDALELIAPVVAVRSASDPPAAPPRLVDGPLVLELGGLSVGLVNTLGDASPEELFGRAVD